MNQRLVVVPRPQVEDALSRPATRTLTVTDAGYFPRAEGHRRVRPDGAPEHIVLLCVGGSGVVETAGERHRLTTSSCITIPARQPHLYESAPEDPWSLWWLHIRGSAVPELTRPGFGRPNLPSRLRALDRATALFDELLSLMERRLSPAHMLAATGVAWQLLTRIETDSALPIDGSPLERAMKYLEDRIDGTIRVDELAAIVAMSPSHLSALFRRATGGGPATFHTSLKMAKARTLLDTSTHTITEIAAATGYADPLYFSRHFHRIHGVTPSAYRAQHKG